MTDLYTCPICAAVFAREYQHCEVCGRHYRGEHSCEGPVDWEARRKRAVAFVRQPLKPGKPWASLTYEYED